MWLTFGDAESLGQKAFNIPNMRAICIKSLSHLQAVCLSAHIKSVFHINWLVYGVIDKLQSEKRQNGRGRGTGVCECHVLLSYCCVCFHTFTFIFCTLVDKKEDVSHSSGVKLKAVLQKRLFRLFCFFYSSSQLLCYACLLESHFTRTHTHTLSGLR